MTPNLKEGDSVRIIKSVIPFLIGMEGFLVSEFTILGSKYCYVFIPELPAISKKESSTIQDLSWIELKNNLRALNDSEI